MQTRFLSSLLLAFTAVVMFASCSKTNKQGLYIPKNAAIVLHFNGESISEKLPWEEIKKSEYFKEASQDTSVSAFSKAILENPENSGIDVKKDLILFLQKDSLGGYFAIEGTVKDEAKFKQLALEAIKGGTPSDKDGINFVAKEKLTISWKKDQFIMVVDVPEMNNMNKYNAYDIYDSIPSKKEYRDGVGAATALYTIKEDNSLAKDEKFTELMNTKGDVHFWMNGEALNSGMNAMAALGMANIGKLTEGSVTTGTASFENGKIVADFKSYSNKEVSEIWKKYSGSAISADMAKRVPTKDIAVYFALNFKAEGIREIFKLAGMEGLINMGTATLGFSFDDFVKANKGDLMFLVSDLKQDSTGKKDASFLFATSIGDKASFAKLIDAGKKAGEKMGDLSGTVSFNSNDNYFAIGNDKTNVDKYITASGSAPDFWDKISGSPAGAYVNFQYIFNSIKERESRDSIQNEMFIASAKFWDNLLVKGGDFKDNAMTQHFEINLVDKNTNSLKQLNNYFATLAKLEKLKEEKLKAEWNDNWVTPPIADTVTVVTPAR